MVKRMRLLAVAVILVCAIALLAGGPREAHASCGCGHATAALVLRPSCGATWQSVPSPSLWPSTAAFNGVAAAGPNDVWVVGSEECPA